jgi:hypothetical protein
MDIRVRAALYSIGFFVGIFALALGLNAIAPYIELWMISVFFIALLFYTMYQLMLTKLKFDEDLGRLNNRDKE